jgi:hypothetical protein
MIGHEDTLPPPMEPEEPLRCSFCHKPQDAVILLVSSPLNFSDIAYICEECIAICCVSMGDLVKKHTRTATPPAGVVLPSWRQIVAVAKADRAAWKKAETKPAKKASAKKVNAKTE